MIKPKFETTNYIALLWRWSLQVWILNVCSHHFSFVNGSMCQENNNALYWYETGIAWCFGIGCLMPILYLSYFPGEVHLYIKYQIATGLGVSNRKTPVILHYLKCDSNILYHFVENVFLQNIFILFVETNGILHQGWYFDTIFAGSFTNTQFYSRYDPITFFQHVWDLPCKCWLVSNLLSCCKLHHTNWVWLLQEFQRNPFEWKIFPINKELPTNYSL